MDQDLCAEFTIRSAIMDLLTEEEVARMCAGTLEPLQQGDEYLDLLRLDLEIQHITGRHVPSGTLIARRAVDAQVWGKILARLSRA